MQRGAHNPRAAVGVGLAPVRQAFPERFQKQHVLFSEHWRNPRFDCSLDSSGVAVVEFNHINESPMAARQSPWNEATLVINEIVFAKRRSQSETNGRAESYPLVKLEGSIMWAIISSIYRAYC